MLGKVKDHFIRQRVLYVGMVGIVGLHMWWKFIQDYGPGDRGLDYPHKRMIKKLSESDKDEVTKET